MDPLVLLLFSFYSARKYSTLPFQIQLTILDWDKLSSNDCIGDATVSVKDLIESAYQSDPARLG